VREIDPRIGNPNHDARAVECSARRRATRRDLSSETRRRGHSHEGRGGVEKEMQRGCDLDGKLWVGARESYESVRRVPEARDPWRNLTKTEATHLQTWRKPYQGADAR
jgi:hypothetical protein